MTTTSILPMATDNSQQACSTDFMLCGACVNENSKPVTENMISAAVITTI